MLRMTEAEQIIVPADLSTQTRENLEDLVNRLAAENTLLREENQAILLQIEELKKYLAPQAVEYILTGKHADILNVTMLFMDIEGFTAFSAALDHGKGDADQLLQAVNPIYQIAEDIFQTKYSGHINKLVGDAVLVTFGAPGSTPNQEEAAVKAALEFQDRLTGYCREKGLDLKARIGIKTGYVISGAIGGTLRKQIDVLGNNVNLSQRIEDHVKHVKGTANRILTDEETFKATQHLARFSGPIYFTPKGLDADIPVYDLVALETKERKFAEEKVILYERNEEYGLLENIKEAVKSGNPKIVAFVGDSGTGKTELVRRALLSDKSFYHVSEYCNPLEQTTSFSLVSKILKQILGLSHGDITKRLSELGLDGKTVLPLYGALINRQFEGYNLAGSAEAVKEQVIGLFCDAVIQESHYRAESGFGGLILNIDDIHNIDQGSQDALDALAAKLKDEKALIVLTHHPDYKKTYPSSKYVKRELKFLQHAANIDLLLRDMLGNEGYARLSKHIKGRIARITGGDPIYVRVVAQKLRQVYESDESEKKNVNKLADIVLRDFETTEKAMPDKIADEIVKRAKRLGEWAFYTLQLMSVAGKISYKTDIGRLVNFQPDYGLLIQHGFLSPSARNQEFAHDKIWRAFYESIPPEERKKLHTRFAEIIEQANKGDLEQVAHKVAYHYTQSNQREKAIPYYEMAAKRSLAVFGNEEAINNFESIAKILCEKYPLNEVLAKLNEMVTAVFKASDVCLFNLADFNGVREREERALELSDVIINFGKETRMRALNGLGLSYIREKRYDNGRIALEEAESIALELERVSQETPNRVAWPVQNWRLPNILLNLGILYDRREEEERISAGLFEPSKSSEKSLEYLTNAEDYYRQAIELALKRGIEHIPAQAYINLAVIFMKRGNTDEALEFCEVAYELNNRLGRQDDLANILINRGSIYRHKALLNSFSQERKEVSYALVREAVDKHNQAYSLARTINNYRLIALSAANLAHDYVLLCDMTKAKEYLHVALTLNPKLKQVEISNYIDAILEDIKKR